ncbi:MAG: hypothetical protein H7835_16145 [Magnetococcus sp. XQGC-1]
MYFLRFNIYFLIGLKHLHIYISFLKFPVFQPRNDSIIFFNFYKNFFDKFFIRFFFEPGIGSSFLIKFFFNFYSFNILGVDRSFFSFLFLNFFLRRMCIYNSEWGYIFNSFRKNNIFFCNPPYLSFKDVTFFYFNDLKEYKNALATKNNGFFDLFYLIKQSYDSLLNNGFFFLEHGYLQRHLVKKIMLLVGFINVYTYKDINGLNRITVGEK